ncbi:leukocyte receptor cluster member 1 [Patella vulgata]|uniref:leukocyte receptor cluster member 1 n=1 Tax=Patella vulgata TaxID=6465 RepID=UPI00217F78F8|nr:leukocyte receptor cluster member 1 [Patella vulgata]
MNILHHKSWHVRTKKNIERVRKDEEKAAEAEKEKERKIALAEQEARTDILRSRAKDKIQFTTDGETNQITSGSSSQIVPSEIEKSGNINFFKEIEDGLRKQGINEEHAKEKKAEKEKWEKSIGLLTYLGKSNIEEQNETPWYITGKSRKRKHEEDDEDEERSKYNKVTQFDKEDRKKADLDPLNQMKEYIDKKKKKKKHKDHKEKKNKHGKQKHTESKQDKHLPRPSTSKTIEQLRAERLKRENKEKYRTSELFSKLTGDNSKKSDSEDEDDISRERSRKYNSQYNPELSRKYKKRSYDDFS